MPRIICWNIQNFSGGKMNTAVVANVITSTVYPVLGGVSAADMLVVVEVMARNTGLGQVPTNAGAAGMTLLLAALQAVNVNWRCVPPISIADGGGRAEAIGVFYLNNVFTFTGPHVWSNFGPMPAAQIGATVAPWNIITAGANAANVPFPAPWNVGTFAGAAPPSPQIDFPNPAGPGFLEFPIVDYRRPLRCQFTYTPPMLPLHHLDLWVVHMPPQRVSARNATFILATVADLALPDPVNSIRVVCGDFNLNTANAWQYGGYGGMTGLGFTPAIGNAMASFLPAGTNTHFADKPSAANYVLGGLSLDNVLTRGPVVPNFFAVVDRVAGTPNPPTPPNPPWGHAMFNPLPFILAQAQPGQSQMFRGWVNFGHIGNRRCTGNMAGRRGASDHMPLAIRF